MTLLILSALLSSLFSCNPQKTSTTPPSPVADLVVGKCFGDCNGDQEVDTQDFITAIKVISGQEPIDACASVDVNKNGKLDSDERHAMAETYGNNSCTKLASTRPHAKTDARSYEKVMAKYAGRAATPCNCTEGVPCECGDPCKCHESKCDCSTCACGDCKAGTCDCDCDECAECKKEG
jgi:Dockerin type I domain